jgi:hypothetical protein
MFSRTEATTFHDLAETSKSNPGGRKSGQQMTRTQDRKRIEMMSTFKVSLMMDKVGTLIVNAALLAALPTALVSILVQAF